MCLTNDASKLVNVGHYETLPLQPRRKFESIRVFAGRGGTARAGAAATGVPAESDPGTGDTPTPLALRGLRRMKLLALS